MIGGGKIQIQDFLQDRLFGFASQWGTWDWAEKADFIDFRGLAATCFDFYAQSQVPHREAKPSGPCIYEVTRQHYLCIPLNDRPCAIFYSSC